MMYRNMIDTNINRQTEKDRDAKTDGDAKKDRRTGGQMDR